MGYDLSAREKEVRGKKRKESEQEAAKKERMNQCSHLTGPRLCYKKEKLKKGALGRKIDRNQYGGEKEGHRERTGKEGAHSHLLKK